MRVIHPHQPEACNFASTKPSLAAMPARRVARSRRRRIRAEDSREESIPAGRVLCFIRGTYWGIVNVGTERYRQVAVELK